MSAILFLILRILLVVVLYAFLAVALYTIWRDLKQRSTESRETVQHRITILLDGEDGIQIPYQLVGSNLVIGRDPVCDLNLEDSTLSAQHAKLSFRHGHWWVEDLRSTNGTYLNQETVDEPMVLTDGDQLRCGRVRLRISTHEQVGSPQVGIVENLPE